jgi:transcriptional regulator with XRE-family HTH domain
VLRSARERRGLTLGDIWRQHDIPSGYLSSVERARYRAITPESLERLARAYEVPAIMLYELAFPEIVTAVREADALGNAPE